MLLALGCAAPAPVPVGALDVAGACAVEVRPRVDRRVDPRHAEALLTAARTALPALALRWDVGAPGAPLDLGDPLAGDDLGPLEAWLAAEAQPPRAGVELLIVPALARPDTLAARTLGTLRGLALSPWAPAADRPTLTLRGAYTPTVLLSVAELHGRPDAGRVVAHEIGHALGLAHDPHPENLMSAGSAGTTLDAAQRDRVFSTACPELP